MKQIRPIHKRPVIALQEAEQVMEPWLEDLRESLHQGWAVVQAELNEDPLRRAMYDQSTQASMFYNAFVMALTAKLAGQPGVEFQQHGRMTMIRLGERVRLRFKKLDSRLRSKNIKTRNQAEIYFQLTLPGIDEPLTDLTFGYVADRTGTKLRGAWITCPVSWSRNAWTIPIFDALSDAMPLLPVGPPDQPLPEIMPKTGKSRKASSE